MKNYLDYPIRQKINTFFDLYSMMNKYDNDIAFVNKSQRITYKSFCADIRKASHCFEKLGNTSNIYLNLADKYNFCVALFSTLLSGNTAYLQPPSVPKLSCWNNIDFSLEIDDSAIKKIIESDDCDLLYKKNENIAIVLCSSGTTAAPKAVALSESNIISDMLAGMQKYEFKEYGRYVNILPYTHAFGLVCDLLAPIYSKSTIYFSYDMYSFLTALVEHNPTALNITPGICQVILQRLNNCNDKTKIVGTSLEKILSGGAGTPASLVESFRAFNITVCGCYGLSECAPCVCVNRDFYYKDGSAGIPLNCNKVEILESGLIKITGSNVMLGYLDAKGNLIPSNGEFISGDLGYVDEDGFLYVEGRIDDLIVFSNGTKVMPQTIEAKLNQLEGIVESIVVYTNDVLTAFIYAQSKETNLIEQHIKKLTFAEMKIGKICFLTSPLERNMLGKVDRKKYVGK